VIAELNWQQDAPNDAHPASREAYEGRLAIRQSIAAAQQQISFLRGELAQE